MLTKERHPDCSRVAYRSEPFQFAEPTMHGAAQGAGQVVSALCPVETAPRDFLLRQIGRREGDA